MRIRITRTIPEGVFEIPVSAREAPVGLIFTADDQAVEETRASLPHFPRLSDTFEVEHSHFISVLRHTGCLMAAREWGRHHHRIIRVPRDCAIEVHD